MAELTSVAIRVANMEAMIAFYSEAFGAVFKPVDVGGLACHFGAVGDVTLKLVPLRSEADFENYPLHQLGFSVPALAPVLESAEQLGGAVEGEVTSSGEGRLAVVRDPDGNTIELVAPTS